MRSDPDDLSLRPAAHADLDDVAAMFSRSRRAAVGSMPPPVHTPAEDRDWLGMRIDDQEPGDQEVWLAERDGRVVGLLLLEGSWLHSLYVDPADQARGVGSTLLDLAKGLRPDGLELWVFVSNDGAQRLYRRAGFVEVERTDGAHNEERAPDLRMTWCPRDAR